MIIDKVVLLCVLVCLLIVIMFENLDLAHNTTDSTQLFS